jgi:DNA modification methylase
LNKSWDGAETRNRRSVWTVASSRYGGAHFATFPPALIEPCILAGAPFNGLVLDPFTGSGTTAAVALQHGRRFVGCELNPDYIKLAEARIAAAEAEVLW